jgi:hypothetical protein
LPEEPGEEASLYRLVLEHGDFETHNMSISRNAEDEPTIASVYDWETGCIAPTLLSNTEVSVTVDLVTDEDARLSVSRLPKGSLC